GFSIYPGAKFVLASASRGRLELVNDVDLGFTKYFATDHMGSSVSDGTGFWGHVGPGLRLWITPALAISYTALLDLNWRTGRQGEIPGQVASTAVVDSEIPRQSDDFSVGFYGRFALIGVF
ncbi:MAG TPA: hypothetical protein VK989_01535, partial [Polyangia bacterium]|nr:hypothetical protein [Polyangia bacterium]